MQLIANRSFRHELPCLWNHLFILWSSLFISSAPSIMLFLILLRGTRTFPLLGYFSRSFSNTCGIRRVTCSRWKTCFHLHHAILSLWLKTFIFQLQIVALYGSLLSIRMTPTFFRIFFHNRSVINVFLAKMLVTPQFINVQGRPKKPDCFWELITLRRLVVEMHVICQNLANFI